MEMQSREAGIVFYGVAGMDYLCGKEKKRMATTLKSILGKYSWLSELAELTWAGEAGAELTLTVTVDDEGVFKNSYTADSAGEVTVYDLDRIVERALGDGMTAVVIMQMGTAVARTRVLRNAADPGMDAYDYAEEYFFTTNHKERNTAEGRRETLTFWTDEAEGLWNMEKLYYDPELGITKQNATSGWSLAGMVTIDASPVTVESETWGRLIGYTVKAGKREMSYRVLPSMGDAATAFIFRNNFGAWETAYLTGTVEQQPSHERSAAMVGGVYRVYDIEETASWKVDSGPLRAGMIEVINDLARSKEIYLLNDDGTAGDEVAVTDCDLKASNDWGEVQRVSITYRKASRRASMGKVRPKPRLFDVTFDETYD